MAIYLNLNNDFNCDLRSTQSLSLEKRVSSVVEDLFVRDPRVVSCFSSRFLRPEDGALFVQNARKFLGGLKKINEQKAQVGNKIEEITVTQEQMQRIYRSLQEEGKRALRDAHRSVEEDLAREAGFLQEESCQGTLLDRQVQKWKEEWEGVSAQLEGEPDIQALLQAPTAHRATLESRGAALKERIDRLNGDLSQLRERVSKLEIEQSNLVQEAVQLMVRNYVQRSEEVHQWGIRVKEAVADVVIPFLEQEKEEIYEIVQAFFSQELSMEEIDSFLVEGSDLQKDSFLTLVREIQYHQFQMAQEGHLWQTNQIFLKSREQEKEEVEGELAEKRGAADCIEQLLKQGDFKPEAKGEGELFSRSRLEAKLKGLSQTAGEISQEKAYLEKEIEEWRSEVQNGWSYIENQQDKIEECLRKVVDLVVESLGIRAQFPEWKQRLEALLIKRG